MRKKLWIIVAVLACILFLLLGLCLYLARSAERQPEQTGQSQDGTTTRPSGEAPADGDTEDIPGDGNEADAPGDGKVTAESGAAATESGAVQEVETGTAASTEPNPPQSQATEPQPTQTRPTETSPRQTAPPETAPPQTQPPETAPPETAPPETQPPQTQPTEPPSTEAPHDGSNELETPKEDSSGVL